MTRPGHAEAWFRARVLHTHQIVTGPSRASHGAPALAPVGFSEILLDSGLRIERMFDTLVDMDLLSTSEAVADIANDMPLAELRDALIDAQATISAAQARFAQALAVFRSRDGHAIGAGFPTFGRWATVDLGLSTHQTGMLADAGEDARECPALREAWETGQLSTTKATSALGVATTQTDKAWCDMALEASSNQLTRIVRTYRRNQPADDTGDGDQSRRDHSDSSPRSETGVWWRDRDDGLAELTAILATDDAAVVRAALEAQAELAWRARQDVSDDEVRDDTNRDRTPRSERMADALGAMAAAAQQAGPVPIVRGHRTEVVLHIDQAYLAGLTDSGRCHLDNGPDIDLATARRLACDARIRAMVHGADGSVVDLGRSQRLVSDKQRRLLTERDHGCRYPGCTNTRYVDAHHVVHWEDGGPTDMANLILLCNRHHHDQHSGRFDVVADGHGDFEFFDRWHRPIGPPRARAQGRCRPAAGTTRARSGGDPRLDVSDAVTALAGVATHTGV